MPRPHSPERSHVITRYSGWVLSDRDGLLAALAEQGVAPRYPVLACDHITLCYPAGREQAAPVGVVRVFGVGYDACAQALAVEVAGSPVRPDGRIYHITLSLTPGTPPAASNDLLTTLRSGTGGSWRRLRVIVTPVRPL